MIYMLAPMQDITDAIFRTISHKYGADITFTEMVRITALHMKIKNTWDRIKSIDDTPTVIQLIGSKEEHLSSFLKEFRPEPGFRGFNLNLGCPDPDVIELGYGAAMIKRVKKTQELVNIIKKNKYPVSIKLRLGLNKYEKEKKAYLNIIKNVDCDFFIVHARHGGESYDEPADFSVYPECVKTGKKIIANGDIRTTEQIKELESIGIKGVMIGRAAVRNPSVFNSLKGLASPDIEKIRKEYIALSEKTDSPFRYRKNVLKHLIQ